MQTKYEISKRRQNTKRKVVAMSHFPQLTPQQATELAILKREVELLDWVMNDTDNGTTEGSIVEDRMSLDVLIGHKKLDELVDESTYALVKEAIGEGADVIFCGLPQSGKSTLIEKTKRMDSSGLYVIVDGVFDRESDVDAIVEVCNDPTPFIASVSYASCKLFVESSKVANTILRRTSCTVPYTLFIEAKGVQKDHTIAIADVLEYRI